MSLNIVCAADIPEPDTSYMIPWNLDMLYQVDPELKKIAARTVVHKRQQFHDRLNAYTAAKHDAWKLVGWDARDPRLRTQGAWDCFFNYILKELDL